MTLHRTSNMAIEINKMRYITTISPFMRWVTMKLKNVRILGKNSRKNQLKRIGMRDYSLIIDPNTGILAVIKKGECEPVSWGDRVK